MQLNNVSLDNLITEVKPTATKVGVSKNRTLSGKLFIDYIGISLSWNLSFEMLTKAERDSLYNIFKSDDIMQFTDENGQVYNVIVTSENFDDNITYTQNGTLYYSVNITIEQDTALNNANKDNNNNILEPVLDGGVW